MSFFPFAAQSSLEQSDVLRVIDAERYRQWRQLTMIASESLCHPQAAAVLAGELGHIYAEGTPQPILCPDPRDSALDESRFDTWQPRLADGRFYKGTINANRVELIAQMRIAEVFAMLDASPAADDIHVNVQPLSGAAANLSVFTALLDPGDAMMGLDLAHGGHLTHGSKFNFTGKTYKPFAYGIDPSTRKLDYAQLAQQARQCKPRIIIAGGSAYPWDFDWPTLRHIADDVGAYLLADIAHLAGMVAAGVLSNPLPHAHVVTFTTHKTLCGPRGAAILTSDPDLAHRMDLAVFPGLQGGPHMNSIAAIARQFELILADRPGFCSFQERVVANTGYFAKCLESHGMVLEYGGTNTHMLLVDLKPFAVKGDVPLDGEIAARLLELAGVVCNKNVIPGDLDAAHASGLRFGLPWLTQRGITREQLAQIAEIVHDVLAAVQTTSISVPSGQQKCRGRVPFGVLEDAAAKTLAISTALAYPPKPDRAKAVTPMAVGDRVVLLLRGDKVHAALSQMLSARLEIDGPAVRAWMLRSDGSRIDDVIAMPLGPQRWIVLPHAEHAKTVRRWIEGLSDGYLLFDPDDAHQKIDGPTAVETVNTADLPALVMQSIKDVSSEPAIELTKPFFIGQQALYSASPPAPKSEYAPPEAQEEGRKTVLNAVHHELGAKMAAFADWDMPIHYKDGIFAEHRAVRTGAGLFDVSHMSALEVRGKYALVFLDELLANCVSRLADGQAQYTAILDPDGIALDDLYLYRFDAERFMLVCNAANAQRVKDWITAAQSGNVIIDRDMPAKVLDGPVEIRDLRDAGEDSRVGLALQGPASRKILQQLAENEQQRDQLGRLIMNRFTHVTLAGLPAMVARTGYTGEKLGFEVYVHPQAAVTFWHAVLDCGRPQGVTPAGLGARDSTRIEAGLPLFGHDLEGPLSISMHEAGYGYVARLHVPFFIGRKALIKRIRRPQRHLLRLRGTGRKTLRPGHVILNEARHVVGEVTSFAYTHPDMTFVVLACVEPGFAPQPGQVVTGARLTAEKYKGQIEQRSIVELTAMPRFPEDHERNGWPARYAR